MSFYQDDLRAIAELRYPRKVVSEAYEDDFEIEPGLEEDPGIGFEDDTVIEIDPVAPVESFSEEDDKVLRSDLKKLAEYSARLKDMDSSQFEPWMIAKITKAADWVDDVWHMLDVEVDFANTGFDQAGPEQDLNY